MMTINKFAVKHIGDYSLGRSNPENMVIEFESIKKAVKHYRRGGKANFATYATEVVKHELTREKINQEQVVKNVPKNNVSNNEDLIHAEFDKVRNYSQFDRNFLAAELKKINKTERKWLALQYGLIGRPLTLREIGAKFGKHFEWVRQVNAKNLNKMKKNM
jgi:DNA-directed RNA polymerase sigma subunit (sigma70/sigma32)